MELIKLLSGPIIGALIGYCTNYIAVKMLFRPLKPIYIGTFQLPFTPGIIPKRKPELAKAVGKAVGNTLINTKDIEQILSSEEMKETVSESILTSIRDMTKDKNLQESIQTMVPEESYQTKRTQLEEYVSERITESICSVDIGGLLAQKGQSVLGQAGGMLAMFLNEDTLQMITQPLGEKIKEYIREDGQTVIKEQLELEVQKVEEMKTDDLLELDSMEKIKKMIEELYEQMIQKNSAMVMEHFKIEEIVQEKINEMDAAQLEELVMSVMKNELGMIVNLGALIGFVIGLLNIAV